MDDEEVFDISKVVDNVNGVENININKQTFDRENICIHWVAYAFKIRYQRNNGSFFPVSYTLVRLGGGQKRGLKG